LNWKAGVVAVHLGQVHEILSLEMSVISENRNFESNMWLVVSAVHGGDIGVAVNVGGWVFQDLVIVGI